ncbi:FAD/NAD(P)-binding protein (plasmid) [Thioclava sp. 'Guangxiensis']|uniref:FAD/NAD(P)-binding protein n=1 Tax=Thioclava sp. 'Guangxiensis' TaxID=3149044 RepID=UPI0032C3DA86
MEKTFAIVGCGATAISFLDRHLTRVEADGVEPGNIFIFEKRLEFGCGAAYEPDMPSNILNTKTGFITPFPNQPGHFHAWLEENPKEWRSAFPFFDTDPHGYAPRPLFGLYLRAQVRRLVNRGASLGCRIVLIQAEVSELDHHDRSEILKTSCGLVLRADKVFLFCGTLGKQASTDAHDGRILDAPYPVSCLGEKIERNDRVAILGARLSAIDAVIALIEGGHRGKIRMHSRSGYFPVVRGTQSRISLQRLTPDRIRALCEAKGKLDIRDVVALFHEERLAQDPVGEAAAMDLPSPPADLAAFLGEEIRASQEPRLWQAILYATNGFIEVLWAALSEDAQLRFMNNYFSMFMAYRVSIPIENARKILGYLSTGQLEFLAGPFAAPDLLPEGFVTIATEAGNSYEYDRVIYAIGAPREAAKLDSPLLRKLIEQEVCHCHPMGGIRVCPISYRLLGDPGTSREIYAVGELTVGQNFFTSALEINARHAYRCADALSPERDEAILLRA